MLFASTSPTTASSALSGATWSRWKATTSSRAMLSTDFLHPIGGWPSGCEPMRKGRSSTSATVAGSSFWASIAPIVSSFLRANSESGNVGETITSRNSSSPVARSFLSTSQVTTSCSLPADDSSEPPTKAMSSAISWALRRPAPWVRRSAVRPASPSFPGGSSAEPVFATMRSSMSGSRRVGMTNTVSPFGSRVLV